MRGALLFAVRERLATSSDLSIPDNQRPDPAKAVDERLA
jgi:hypothetical protein